MHYDLSMSIQERRLNECPEARLVGKQRRCNGVGEEKKIGCFDDLDEAARKEKASGNLRSGTTLPLRYPPVARLGFPPASWLRGGA